MLNFPRRSRLLAFRLGGLAVLAAVLGSPVLAGPVVPGPVSDPVGDFVPTYTGTPGADLDVTFTQVIWNPYAGTLTFAARMAGNLGQTPNALYVWGLDRGQGTERFQAPPAGQPATGAGVFFDSVLLLRPDGTASFTGIVGGGSIPNLNQQPGVIITVDGPSITAVVPIALIPTLANGVPIADWSYNLWPRQGAGNNNQISDFAPNAANETATLAPEPSTLTAAGLGLGIAVLTAFRSRSSRRSRDHDIPGAPGA